MRYLLTCLLILFCLPVCAEDLRSIYRQAVTEKRQVEKELRQELSKILNDRKSFESALKELEAEYKRTERDIERELDRNSALNKEIRQTEKSAGNLTSDINALENTVAASGDDFLSLSRQYGNVPLDINADDTLAAMRNLAEGYFAFYKKAGSVSRSIQKVMDESGRGGEKEVVSLGTFASVYMDGEDAGYLEIRADGGYEVVAGQTGRIKQNVKEYLSGESESAGLDIASGAVYVQWKNRITPATQIKKGGVLVYPIFAVFVFALMLASERVYRLYIRGIGDVKAAEKVSELLKKGAVQEAGNAVEGMADTPVGRVARKVFSSAGKPANVRNDIIEQALISEASLLERNLSLLSMSAAVSPMLGLMGTVTGMIGTFHAITVFGSSDPRMMAGGISEALTTTMLGLTAAIPVMLLLTVFNRRTEILTDLLQDCALNIASSQEADHG